MTGLGDLPGGTYESTALGVSADGSVVVGQSRSLNGREAFRWVGGTMTGLGDLPGGSFNSLARAVSADGSVVVGVGRSASGSEAFRWVGGTMTGLGDLPGGNFFSNAYDVSADGSVVVGQSASASGSEAFRWVGGTMTGLGDLPGGIYSSFATGVSADGSVVVGRGTSASGLEAFRWEGGTMTGLGDLPGGPFFSTANAVSGDGSVVVGSSRAASRNVAFRWEGGSMAALGDLLAAKGIDQTGITLLDATGISDDGTVIVGNAFTTAGNEAFIAVYDEPASGATTPATGVVFVDDFSISVQSVSNTSRLSGASGQGLDRGLEFTGLNARSDETGKARAAVPTEGSVRGSVGRGLSYSAFVFGEGSRVLDTGIATREVGSGGVGLKLKSNGSGLDFGLSALVVNQSTTTSALGSRSSIHGLGAGLFLTYAPAPTGIELLFTASRMALDGDIDRNYLNGATTETSSGSTSGNYTGFQGRVGYAMQTSQNLTLTPFAGLSSHRAELDGYTETGGTFAGTVSAQTSNLRKAKLGLDARFRLRSNLDLTTAVSVEHVKETGTFSSVSVTPLGGATFGGGSGARTYNAADVSLGVNYRASSNVALYSQVNASHALSSGASDIDRVGIQIGAAFSF
ncbi:autotransporter domain-containing protein [uncultured Tateyamaria sp.]|uniref:autotransporter domain-containing protein n=1 Tax=uncultured Tateyamaria sp. TaxID=455651 RepID=UPI0026056E22|nr:autotransporter domain-containing protein [uncultured Tateyamaria sp.]